MYRRHSLIYLRNMSSSQNWAGQRDKHAALEGLGAAQQNEIATRCQQEHVSQNDKYGAPESLRAVQKTFLVTRRQQESVSATSS